MGVLGRELCGCGPASKKIRKCERVAEYECLVDALFREKELRV
ncbi:MAG: hypothetical protein ACLR78_08650 [Roseburia sp.]